MSIESGHVGTNAPKVDEWRNRDGLRYDTGFVKV